MGLQWYAYLCSAKLAAAPTSMAPVTSLYHVAVTSSRCSSDTALLAITDEYSAVRITVTAAITVKYNK